MEVNYPSHLLFVQFNGLHGLILVSCCASAHNIYQLLFNQCLFFTSTIFTPPYLYTSLHPLSLHFFTLPYLCTSLHSHTSSVSADVCSWCPISTVHTPICPYWGVTSSAMGVLSSSAVWLPIQLCNPTCFLKTFQVRRGPCLDKMSDYDWEKLIWRPLMKQNFTGEKSANCTVESEQPRKHSFQNDKHHFDLSSSNLITQNEVAPHPQGNIKDLIFSKISQS